MVVVVVQKITETFLLFWNEEGPARAGAGGSINSLGTLGMSARFHTQMSLFY
jgi:hypothetical protein